MRDLINILETIINEGGNIWKDQLATKRILRADVMPTIRFLEKITGLPLADVAVGSFKRGKPDSGDIDILIDQTQIDKDVLQKRLNTWAEKNDPTAYTKKTGTSVHFRTPIKSDPANGYVQTDFMFVDDVPFALFSLSIPAPVHVAVASIAKHAGLKWSWQKGLTSRTTGNLIPGGKEPESVVKILLGPDASPDDLKSVESIVASLKDDPEKEAKLADAAATLDLELNKMVRESMILTERSRGLLFRAEGDRFFKGKREQPDQVLVFQKAEYFPSIPGEYDTHEEMMTAYRNQAKKYAGMLPVNNPTKANKAFAVLTMKDEKTQQPVYSSRFFNDIKPNMAGTWSNSELSSKKNEYQLDKEVSLKSAYKLKPSDIFSPPARFKNVSQLLKAFEASPTAKPFVPGFEMLYQKDPQLPVFENAEPYLTAIRDDLGEIIGPVALIQGIDMGSGADAARKDLLGDKGSWAGSSISFPAGKTNNLVDSYIVTSNGTEVGLSSKGEKGATASIRNISDGVRYIKTSGTPAQKKMLVQYKDTIDLINEISTSSPVDFPIDHGMQQGLISKDTGTAIKYLIQSGAKTLKGLKKEVKAEISELMAQKSAITEKQNYNAGYHALAALAMIVAAEINEDEEFGEACLKLLNSSPIIQLHMSVAKRAEGTIEVTGFTSKYPPNFQGTVVLDANKNYSATGNSGRLTFSYEGKEDAKAPRPSRVPPAAPAVALKKAAADIVDKKIMKKKPAPAKVIDVGRAKRK